MRSPLLKPPSRRPTPARSGSLVPGALPGKPLKNGQPGPSTACAVIVKHVDEKTRAKTSINELLRD